MAHRPEVFEKIDDTVEAWLSKMHDKQINGKLVEEWGLELQPPKKVAKANKEAEEREEGERRTKEIIDQLVALKVSMQAANQTSLASAIETFRTANVRVTQAEYQGLWDAIHVGSSLKSASILTPHEKYGNIETLVDQILSRPRS